MAGQIAELAPRHARRDFRSIDPARGARPARRVRPTACSPASPPSLSRKAAQPLRAAGRDTAARPHRHRRRPPKRVAIAAADGERSDVGARTVSGPPASVPPALASELARAAGAELDRAGRVTVDATCTLPGHPEVFALGDMVRVLAPDGTRVPLPGVAPVAMQQGRYAALRDPRPPRRHDVAPPSATTTRATWRRSAASKARRRPQGACASAGFPAWVTWLFVHLFYLIGFQNRLLVFLRWTISFVTHGRGARLITGERTHEDAL